jgi:Leucine-rich repeat (LRR) protein
VEVDLSNQSIVQQYTFNKTQDKTKASVVGFFRSGWVNYLPQNVSKEFFNLNGIMIGFSNMIVLKDTLFSADFSQIEMLSVEFNRIQEIEELAFQHLVNLKWISLGNNNIEALTVNIFRNNPKLEYIGFNNNKIKLINIQVFTKALEYKKIDFFLNECIDKSVGCTHQFCEPKMYEIIQEAYQCFTACVEDEECALKSGALDTVLECEFYEAVSSNFWPEAKYCKLFRNVFFNQSLVANTTFTGTPEQKKETNVVHFHQIPILNFIPVEIFEEFPRLNGLIISESNLTTLGDDFFTKQCKNIEYLDLNSDNIYTITSKAFYHLLELRWINLDFNHIDNLSDKIFEDNIKLEYISMQQNGLLIVNNQFFDNLVYLKYLNLELNFCINKTFSATYGVLNPEEMKDDFEFCYQNCANDFECAYKAGVDLELVHLGNISHISQQIMCNFNGIKWDDFKTCFITNMLFGDINRSKYNFTGSDEEKAGTNAIYFAKFSVIEFIPEETFTEFLNLQAFAIRESNIPILKNTLLAHKNFIKIYKLDLSKNKIQFIEKGALRYLRGLMEIDLSENLLKSISNQVFSKNRFLDSIKLYDNKIMMIQKSAFSKTDSLSHLDLLRNECINEKFEYDENKAFSEEPLSDCISNYRERTEYFKRGIVIVVKFNF